MAIRFLHISDIHLLGLAEGSPLDLNRRYREALELDVAAYVAEHGEIDAILIGGDIAASGHSHEFNSAVAWIERLCAIVGATHNDVFCVPGNHDVYRPAARSNTLVRVAEDHLRTCPTTKIDDLLGTILLDPESASEFLSRLDNYHEFAARYDCGVTPEYYAWKRRLPKELDGRGVRLVGLNSALISSEGDAKKLPCQEREKLVLGKGQAYLHADDGDVIIALSHHPPCWLRDAGEVKPLLARAQLHLFGHEHRPRVTEGDETVQIFAGAVQPPSSDQSASPSYNLISLDVVGEAMTVKVSARKWGDQKFTTDEGVGPGEDIPIKLASVSTPSLEPDVSLSSNLRREAMWQLMQRSPEERRVLLARLGVARDDQPLTPLAQGEAVREIAERDLWEEMAGELSR